MLHKSDNFGKIRHILIELQQFVFDKYHTKWFIEDFFIHTQNKIRSS